ncbi:allantoinase AllB [Actinomycetospora sp. TBRC 11914]|uniref:allantoinase AllB n=1 Tax=Actinomycetospora sp. TBRC 11914 TaxID=2729387 RepID=UPI00145DD49C|nr:allantoinase AllB [Actinomycetospora sp. TBRC 11914]NMO93853.1 allantoinase AllB [Actinomycetospora sp. TBRC 11914]
MEPSPTLVVRARRAVLPTGTAPAAVVVADGRITDVTDHDAPAPPGAAVVDVAADEVLLPGLVDSHVHVDEPGRTEWEGFATATAAAAAGGVTTLVDMPLNSIPPTVDVDALLVKRDVARDQVAVDVAFWGGAVPLRDGVPDPDGAVDPDRMAALVDAGVCGFKCFLTDSGVPEFPPVGHADLELAARTCAELDVPLVVHAEDDGVLGEAPAAGEDYRSFLASRPPGAETTAVLRLAAVAARTGARVHVLHVSAFEAAEEIGAARAQGVPITGETCPHYLALASETLTSTAGKCCPPVRSESNRELLWGALGAGRLQAVVSDHSPCPPELKDGGFGQAWGGVSSLELALRVVWSGAAARGHTLDDVAAWMSAAPAALAGLEGAKGAIAAGRDADLVVLAPDEVDEVDPTVLHHRHPVTPYAGLALRGAVRRVWLRGQDPVAGGGRLLTPERKRAT